MKFWGQQVLIALIFNFTEIEKFVMCLIMTFRIKVKKSPAKAGRGGSSKRLSRSIYSSNDESREQMRKMSNTRFLIAALNFNQIFHVQLMNCIQFYHLHLCPIHVVISPFRQFHCQLFSNLEIKHLEKQIRWWCEQLAWYYMLVPKFWFGQWTRMSFYQCDTSHFSDFVYADRHYIYYCSWFLHASV